MSTAMENPFIETMKQIGMETMQAQAKLFNENSIQVMLVGTGNPMGRERHNTATAVFVNNQYLLFDCGYATNMRLGEFRVPGNRLNAIFITHFHADHFADLGEIISKSFINQRRHELEVYGPTGLTKIVNGFLDAYKLENKSRTDHHGAEHMNPQFATATAKEFDGNAESLVVYEKDGVKVTAFKVAHPPVDSSFGYVVEYKGKKVVISGDTIVTDNFKKHAQNADLLVGDAMSYQAVELQEKAVETLGNKLLAKIMRDIREYHLDINELAQLAEETQVKRLALSHFSPPLPHEMAIKKFFEMPAKQHYNGELLYGDDGFVINIPIE